MFLTVIAKRRPTMAMIEKMDTIEAAYEVMSKVTIKELHTCHDSPPFIGTVMVLLQDIDVSWQ
jgi:hypothetical protein